MKQLEKKFTDLSSQEGIDLSTQLTIIKEYATPLLREVERACQKAGFTYHGMEHVQSLGDIIYDLIPPHLFGFGQNQIGIYELFILIGAAYLHDLGMLEPKDREIHNIASANLIYDSISGKSKISGLDDQYASRMAKICMAHRDHKEKGKRIDTLQQIPEDDHLAGKTIKTRLLACLFRLADELDSDFERAPSDLELSLPLGEESQRHWTTHQLIDSIQIVSSRWEIELYPSERALRDPKLLNLVEERCKKIEYELGRMQIHLKNTPFAYKNISLSNNGITVNNQTNNTFVDKIRELFEICGYQVESASNNLDYELLATPLQGLDRRPIYIKCNDDTEDVLILQRLANIRKANISVSLFYITSSSKISIDFYTKCTSLGIECYTYKKLVSQMINFKPYVDRVLSDPGLLKLEHEYEEPNIDTLNGQKLVWSYLDDWLKNDNNWLTILGDYGVGKTALLEMLLLRLMRKYKESPDDNPIPILIPLQNFVKSFTFRNLILALFEDIKLSGVYYDAFENWVKSGRIIILLDSFDEMAQKLTRHEIHSNLRALLSGITGKSKAVLTSRPTYFESSAERLRIFADANLLPEDHDDYQIYKQFSEYDMELQQEVKKTLTVRLSDLTEDQRKHFFRRVLRQNPVALQRIEELIDRIHGLNEMADRPVIARLLMMAVPELQDSDLKSLPTEMNEASLFKLIVTQLLRRDESLFRELLTNSERHSFLKELSCVISMQGQDNYVNNKLLRDVILRLFSHKIQTHETPDIIAEQIFRTCRRAAGLTVEKSASGLAREVDDPASRVGFSHNALREYIFAEYIYEHMFDDRVNALQSATLSDGTYIFLRYMVLKNDLDKMLVNLQAFNKLRDFYFGISWRIMPNQERHDIEKIIGDRFDFSELDLSNMDFSDRDLSDARFKDSLIGGVNFQGTILDRAVFSRSIIDNTAFDDSSLDGTDFSFSEIRSIIVYDSRQKRVLPLYNDDAKQWLYTSGSDIGKTDNINLLMRSTKYGVAHRILQKMARYNFGRTMNEMGLLRGLSPKALPIGRSFLDLLHNKGYFKFVRKVSQGGRGADVIEIDKDKRSELDALYSGKCPYDLLDFFDDIPE